MKGQEALNSIQQETKFSNLEVALLDLASYQSVKNFAKSFLARNLPLDILVSNAGIVPGKDWTLTGDGHEIWCVFLNIVFGFANSFNLVYK